MLNNFWRIFIFPLSKIAIVVIVGVFVSNYFANHVEDIANKIYEKRVILSSFQNSQDQFLILKEGWQKASSNFDTVNNIFLPQDDVLPFINAMENLSRTVSVGQSFKFENTSPQPTQIPELKAIPFNASVSGNWTQFMEYLKQIRKLPYFVSISNVNISSPQNIDSDGTMIFRGLLYVR